MNNTKLTEEQFREHLEEYFSWANKEPQTLMSWLTSLEDWTKASWNKEYAKRFPNDSRETLARRW